MHTFVEFQASTIGFSLRRNDTVLRSNLIETKSYLIVSNKSTPETTGCPPGPIDCCVYPITMADLYNQYNDTFFKQDPT